MVPDGIHRSQTRRTRGGLSVNIVCPACGATNRVPDQRLPDAPVCGRCGAEIMAAMPVNLTDASFPGFIARTELPVLVDFWADWCGPCKMMAPHFENAASRLPMVRFAKLDTEANPNVSTANGIRSIPTLILYRVGREIGRQSGAMVCLDLVRWVHGQLAPGA